MTVQHELQCTHGDSVSNWIFYTQAIFRRLEHRKPSAKMRLCLKDNKPCLVSSGHFLRTARLVRTRHLVHVSNGRYDLAPNPRRLQSSPSTGPSQPRTPSLHLLLFRDELWRSGSQTPVRVATSYLFPWWPQDPWGEVYTLQSSMRCPPRATWGIAGGWLAGGSPLWSSVSKPKKTKFLPLKSNGLLTCQPPHQAPSALQTAGRTRNALKAACAGDFLWVQLQSFQQQWVCLCLFGAILKREETVVLGAEGHLHGQQQEKTKSHLSCTGEGNGNPLQCSCLENPRDGGAWWAAVYGVAQNWTRLKRLSSSSSSSSSSILPGSSKSSSPPLRQQLWLSGQTT